MRQALKIARYSLAACIGVLAVLWLVPLLASVLGFDIQSWKWPVVFYGGLLLLISRPVALFCMILQFAVFMSEKWRNANG